MRAARIHAYGDASVISYDEIPRPSPGPGDSPLATHFVARNDPTQLGELASLVDSGALSVEIAESHPLTSLHDLHRRAESGRTRGKITVIPRSTS